jgi:mRNA interferase MazF
VAVVNRYDIYLVNLDEVSSTNAKNTRPCVVVSPDEMNHNVSHVVIAPVSASNGSYPTRLAIDLLGKQRTVVLDQIRTVDSSRLVKKIGEIDPARRKEIAERLCEFFAE